MAILTEASVTQSTIRRLEQAAAAVAGLCVLSMMAIVCYDAIGRYIFNSPLQWAFDVVSNYLMVGASYLALSATFQRGDHINVNIVHSMLPPRLRLSVDILCSLLTAALFAAITYASAAHAIDAYRGKEFLPGVVMWPVWLSYAPIPVGTGLFVLRLLHHSFTLVRRGADPFVMTEGEGGFE